MQLPIFLYGNQVLRKATQTVTPEYPGLNDLITNMYETMVKADGVGLAAPQVGLSIRLFVIDLSSLADEDEKYLNYKRVFINPEIVSFSEDTCTMEEGCLSVPDIHENVVRSNSIRIKYQDENFQDHDETIEGFEARVIQHEYDHLEGKLFTDRVSPIRRQLIKSKLTGIVKGKTVPRYSFRN